MYVRKRERKKIDPERKRAVSEWGAAQRPPNGANPMFRDQTTHICCGLGHSQSTSMLIINVLWLSQFKCIQFDVNNVAQPPLLLDLFFPPHSAEYFPAPYFLDPALFWSRNEPPFRIRGVIYTHPNMLFTLCSKSPISLCVMRVVAHAFLLIQC